MITAGKFYYASTPRSEPRKALERVQVIDVSGDAVKVKTVETLRTEQEYTLSIDKIKIM